MTIVSNLNPSCIGLLWIELGLGFDKIFTYWGKVNIYSHFYSIPNVRDKYFACKDLFFSKKKWRVCSLTKCLPVMTAVCVWQWYVNGRTSLVCCTLGLCTMSGVRSTLSHAGRPSQAQPGVTPGYSGYTSIGLLQVTLNFSVFPGEGY